MVLHVFLCVILSLVLLIWKLASNRKEKNLPPLAAGALPIVGHTFLVLANKERLYNIVLETIIGASRRQGQETVKIKAGNWNLYVLTNPEDCYLLASCPVKDPMYEFLKPIFGPAGLLNADVPIWKKHRKLLNPCFSNKVLDDYLPQFNEHGRQLVKCLEQNAGKGLFDQLSFIKHTVLQVICVTIMGVDPAEKELQNEAKIALQEFTTCIVERIRKFWYHSNFIYNLSTLKKKQDAAAKTFYTLCDQVIKKKKSQRLQDKDVIEYEDELNPRFRPLMDLLLELAEDGALTDTEIREEVCTFMAAGYDTTSVTITFTLLNIGSYPQVQQKIFDELHEVFEGSDRDTEKQDLLRLKYLEAVVKESMRLYPTAVTVGRILDQDMKFKNFTLPTGSRCFTSIYHLGRHPMWGPDAEQFRPERWLDDSLPKNPYAFAVFGLGKRRCIGNQFALMSIKTLLTHVLRNYHVTGDIKNLVQHLDMVVRPVSGYQISIEKR